MTQSGQSELLESLRDMVRIVEAFSYSTQLGKTQKDRLERAKAAIAKATHKPAEREGQ